MKRFIVLLVTLILFVNVSSINTIMAQTTDVTATTPELLGLTIDIFITAQPTSELIEDHPEEEPAPMKQVVIAYSGAIDRENDAYVALIYSKGVKMWAIPKQDLFSMIWFFNALETIYENSEHIDFQFISFQELEKSLK